MKKIFKFVGEVNGIYEFIFTNFFMWNLLTLCCSSLIILLELVEYIKSITKFRLFSSGIDIEIIDILRYTPMLVNLFSFSSMGSKLRKNPLRFDQITEEF